MFLLVPAFGSAETAAAPANLVQPQILGSAVQGQTLQATTGTWSNGPTRFAFEWRRCPANGGAGDASNCAVITGATDGSYALVGADVGSTIRVRVTAGNGSGNSTKASNATSLVASSSAPANKALPVITGQPQVGATLTASTGTWSGTSDTFTYQWLRCDATAVSCAVLTGATAAQHLVAAAQLGDTLRVQVTAKNASGSAQATSPPTSVIAQPPTGCPAGTGPVQAADVTAPARLVIDQQQASPPVLPVTTHQFTVRYHVANTCGQSVQGALVYATSLPFGQLSVAPEQLTDAGGFAVLSFHTLAGFPVNQRQERIAMFARARKQGENVLTGISNRRLLSIRISR
jgi:hypothetical protein